MVLATNGAQSPQHVAVRRKQLDHHRFGRAGKIADHVLQQLRKFHVQHRLGLRDFGAHVGDHFVARRVRYRPPELEPKNLSQSGAMGFSLTLMSPCVGFRDGGQAELQTRPARRASDFRRLAQNFLHVTDHAIRIPERCAGRHDVIDDESAFVHGGQQIRSGVRVAEVRSGDQEDGEERQNERMFQRKAQRAFVGIHEPRGD